MTVLAELRGGFERAGYATVDLADGADGFLSPCPTCAGAVSVTLNGTGTPIYCCPGGCDDSARADRLDELSAAPAGFARVPEQEPGGRAVRLVAASSIAPRRPRFMWAGRIPLGAVTVLAGPPGLGKTTLSMHLAAAATRGALPGDLEGEATSVIYASAEDSAETTLLPRFLAAGGDPTKLYFVEISLADDDAGAGTLTLPDDTAELGALARETGARLLVLDPVMAYLPEQVNAHRDQHVRRVLAPLARMADDLDASVHAVMHLNKSEGSDALSRVGGSVGFTAAARSVLIFGRDPDDPAGENGCRRILAHAKCNVAQLASSLHAEIEPRTVHDAHGEPIGTSRLVFGATSDQTARDLLAATNVGGEEATARGEARTFLAEELATGPRGTAELKKAAEEADMSWRTVERAKKQLGVRARKTANGWTWALPDIDADNTATA